MSNENLNQVVADFMSLLIAVFLKHYAIQALLDLFPDQDQKVVLEDFVARSVENTQGTKVLQFFGFPL